MRTWKFSCIKNTADVRSEVYQTYEALKPTDTGLNAKVTQCHLFTMIPQEFSISECPQFLTLKIFSADTQ